jgi:hypothetical protein
MFNPHLDQKEAQITLNKMRCILYSASQRGFDGVVLSAFGCGAFRNPPVRLQCKIVVVVVVIVIFIVLN